MKSNISIEGEENKTLPSANHNEPTLDGRFHIPFLQLPNTTTHYIPLPKLKKDA